MPQVLYICETILGMRFFIIFLSFSILGVSCNDTNSKEEQKVPVTVVKDTTLYGKNSFRFPKVSANTQAILEDWPIYNDFQNEVLALQTLSLERVKLVSEKLLTKTDSLSKSIPDTLNSQAVSSRLTILKTRIHLLKQEANKGRFDSLKIENEIDETRNAVKNFVVQIDEKVQKDKIDLQRKDNEEKELEKQQKARDSIFQLELQDQQK